MESFNSKESGSLEVNPILSDLLEKIDSAKEPLELTSQPEVLLSLQGVVRTIRQALKASIQSQLGLNQYLSQELGINPEDFQVKGKGAKAIRYNVKSILKNMASGNSALEGIFEEVDTDLSEFFGSTASAITIETGAPIVIPDELEFPLSTEENPDVNNRGSNERLLVERHTYALEALQEMGLENDQFLSFRGETKDEFFRNEPYINIIIPSLNKIIKICKEYGNRTFIIYGQNSHDGKTKDQLKSLQDSGEVASLIWCNNAEIWKEQLKTLLNFDQAPLQEEKASPDLSSENQKASSKEVSKATLVPRDRAYYENPENVKHDLQAFADQFCCSIKDLNPGRLCQKEITCANGELVKGQTYLNNAGVALKLADDSGEAACKHTVIFERLLKIVGIDKIEYPKRDSAYYSNPENIQHDLQAFASQFNCDIRDLNVNKICQKEITCANGELVKGQTYLNNAGVALKLPDDSKDVAYKHTAIFERLLNIVGIKPYDERDRAYYENPENVKYDLQAFAKEYDCDIRDLNVNKICQKEITCANGESVKGETYLRNAGVVLELANNSGEAGRKFSVIIKKLLNIAGIKPYDKRDRAYYEDPEKVKYDLEAFAKEYDDCDIRDLNVSKLCQISKLCKKGITCANGESVKGQRYLNNAGVALELADNSTEASRKYTAIFERLLNIAGIKPYDKRDSAYYSNPENIQHDLQAFASQFNCDIRDLNVSKLCQISKLCKKGITCANGESVRGQTYLRNAGVALELADNSKDAAHKYTAIFERLLNIAGIKPYDKRDRAYYENPEKVKYDLLAYLKAYNDKMKEKKGGEWVDIGLGNLRVSHISSLKIETANIVTMPNGEQSSGEKVKGQTYLNNAGVALRLADDSTEAKAKSSAILKALLRIATCKAECVKSEKID